jgi:hypothetical protein
LTIDRTASLRANVSFVRIGGEYDGGKTPNNIPEANPAGVFPYVGVKYP